MPWYLFEPEKKPPFVAAEPSTEGDVRIPLSILAFVVAALCLIVGIAGLLFSNAVSGWGIGLGIVFAALGHLLLPSVKR